jgi:hypothetical protein
MNVRLLGRKIKIMEKTEVEVMSVLAAASSKQETANTDITSS